MSAGADIAFEEGEIETGEVVKTYRFALKE
jgi:hypothetical protein